MALVWRHKNKLLFLAALIGGGYVGLKVIWKKMQELQDKEATARLEANRFQDHFLGNCNTVLSAVKEMLPTLQAAIQRELNSEAIIQRLRSKPANKHSLWEELKVISFARFVGGVYAYALLLVFMRVQLAILGGTMLQGVTKNQAQSEEDSRRHKEYLATVQHLLKDGLHALLETVRGASEQVLAHYSLKQQLSNEGVLQLVRDICQQAPLISHSPRSPHSAHSSLAPRRQPHFLLKHTMPKETLLQQDDGLSEYERRRQKNIIENNEILEKLGLKPSTETRLPGVRAGGRQGRGGQLEEELLMATRDIVESEETVEVLEDCVEVVFTHSNSLLLGSLTSASCQKNSPDLALATIIPVMCDTSLCIFQPHSHASVQVQELLNGKPIQALSKNIYEAFASDIE